FSRDWSSDVCSSDLKAAKRGDKLAQAEQKLAENQRYANMVQLQYQTQAEKLRQVRDDESKSIDERMKSNADLGAVLQKQLKQERSEERGVGKDGKQK